MSQFLEKYNGYLAGVMQWNDLSSLWQRIREQQDKAWYIYAVGDRVPVEVVSETQLSEFMDSMDKLLRREHEQDYCGIVYVDDLSNPALVKIYDPHNLGMVCGFSENPPLPGWVMSQLPPVDLELAFPPTASRKRWWQKIFS